MGRSRAIFSALASAAALATLVVRAQTADPNRYVIRENVGLPAIDEGVLVDDSHTPDSDEARRRLAVRALLHADASASSSGAPYRRGRMIVKFKDGVSAADRIEALASASPSGVIVQRPSHADFDLVNLDPAGDAEGAARPL